MSSSSKDYHHTSAVLDRLEELEVGLSSGGTGSADLDIVCQDGVFNSSRLLMGACSELVRHCLHSDAEDGCLILPNIYLWEMKAFHGAVLNYKDTPANAELDAVLKVLTTLGVNIGPYVDVNIGGESSELGEISSICILSVHHKLQQDSLKEDEITLIIPSSLDVFPVTKERRIAIDPLGEESEEEEEETQEGTSIERQEEEEEEDEEEEEVHEGGAGEDDPDLSLKQPVSKYCCPFCEREFVKAPAYEKHLAAHQNSELYQTEKSLSKGRQETLLECAVCNKTFTSLKSYQTHSAIHTDSGNTFECDICSKRFSLKSTFSNHLKSHNPDYKNKRFVCDLCKKVFSHPSNMKRHIRQVHTDDEKARNYACYMCGKRFKDAGTLKSHVESHNDNRKFPCNMCNKSYVKKSQLTTHIRTHTGEKPFSCNLCGKCFKSMGNLKSHKLNRHVGVKLVKSHMCTECGQRFVKEYDLRVHLRRHRGERPFVCLTCGKSFHAERHFLEHNRTHTGEKPFQCETCKKRFSTGSGLRQHFKAYGACRINASEGAYSKFPEKRTDWQRLDRLQIQEFILPEGSSLHNLEEFSVQELKESDETVIYLSTDTDLSLVSGSLIEPDMTGRVNIQALPLQMDSEGEGEVLNLVEMSERL